MQTRSGSGGPAGSSSILSEAPGGRAPRARRWRSVAAAVVAAGLGAGTAASTAWAEDAFHVQVIESRGRTVTAELADLDGDGREDVLQAVTFGMPPDERRVIRAYLQTAGGRVEPQATLEVPIPEASAAYDLADVDGRPGEDLLLLRPRGIGIVSFRRGADGRVTADERYAQIPEDLTIGVSNDERGLDWLPIANDAFGSPPWLVVPGLGETFFLGADGTLQARVASGVRANFFLQPSGLMVSESDIQIFLDAPRISTGDVNGDGRPDIVASLRHRLLIFYRNEDGSFDPEPSLTQNLGRVSFEDHIRGSGAVRTIAKDIDGDGLADLLLSETLGGVMSARFNTYVYFNRGTGWDLGKPDYGFESPEVLGADQLIDVDGDGTLELMRIGIPLSVLELIEIFLQEALDANLAVYGLPRPESLPATARKADEWFDVKLAVPLDFQTSRPEGFIPTVEHDFNGDGFRDYITSTDGTRLEIYVGDREDGYDRRSARQSLATEGQIRPGDLNGDGLTDLVLFNTRRDNQPLRLLTNRGVLPGTVVKPRLQAQPNGYPDE